MKQYIWYAAAFTAFIAFAAPALAEQTELDRLAAEAATHPSGLHNLDSKQLEALAEIKQLCLEEKAGKFKPMFPPTPCEALKVLGIKDQSVNEPAIDWEGRMIGQEIARLPKNHPDRKQWIESCSHPNGPHPIIEPRPKAICEGLMNPW